MNIPASRNNDHLLYWMAAALLLTVFGLGDAAIVAWWASILTFGQLVAVGVLQGIGVDAPRVPHRPLALHPN